MAQVARALSAEDIAPISAWLASRPVPANAKPAAAFAAMLPMPCGGLEANAGKAPR